MSNLVTYLGEPFAQHALLATTLVGLICGVIGPFVVMRGMAFAVHGTSELAFTGAAAGLLVDGNAVGGALAGSLVVAALIGLLGVRDRERDAAVGVLLAFGLGVGIFLLGYYQGYASEATNILFGDVLGVSNGQLWTLVVIAAVAGAVMAAIYRPLLFASVDAEVARARGVPVRALGIAFLFVLALTVTEAAQIVGTLLVLSLAITPAAAAVRLAATPRRVIALSTVFAVVAADGGLLLSLALPTVKASFLITSISFGIYVVARSAGPAVLARRGRVPAAPLGGADPSAGREVGAGSAGPGDSGRDPMAADAG